jgi:hypothetical protein
MSGNNLPGLSALWLISLAMVLGAAIIVMIPISISGGDAIKVSDWIGFAGNVVAGVMTIIAAFIAWLAVQQQIGAQQRTSDQILIREAQERERQCAEAKHAAVIVLAQTVHAAAAVMNVTEQYLEQAHRRTATQNEEEDKQRALQNIRPNQKTTMWQLKATMDHFAIAQAWQQLDLDELFDHHVYPAHDHQYPREPSAPPRAGACFQPACHPFELRHLSGSVRQRTGEGLQAGH